MNIIKKLEDKGLIVYLNPAELKKQKQNITVKPFIELNDVFLFFDFFHKNKMLSDSAFSEIKNILGDLKNETDKNKKRSTSGLPAQEVPID